MGTCFELASIVHGAAKSSTNRISDVASFLQDLLVLSRNLDCLESVLARSLCRFLLLVECITLDLALILQALDEVIVFPSVLMREIAKPAELALGPQAKDLQSLRDNHSLLPVVRVRDAFEGLELVQSCCPSCCLVGDHASDGTPKDLGRSAVMIRSVPGIRVRSLALEIRILELGPVKRP